MYCISGGKIVSIFSKLYASIAVWIPSIHIGFCNPNAGIRKILVCVLWTLYEYWSLNTFNPCRFLWPQYGYCIWWSILWILWAIVVWIPSIQIGFCDPNVDITFEVEKHNACFMNSMGHYSLNTYRFLWPQCRYCNWGGKIQCVFCEFYASIVVCISSI